MEASSSLESLDIEVGDIRLAIGQLDADLVVSREHHIVLGKTSGTVKNSHDTLLHGHLALVEAPRRGVITTVLAAAGLGSQRDTTAGVSDTSRLLDTVGRVALLLQEGRSVALGRNIIVIVDTLGIVVIMVGHGSIGGSREVVLLQSLVNILIVLNLGQTLSVDSLGRILLLNNAQHTVVKMLVEVLGIGEGL